MNISSSSIPKPQVLNTLFWSLLSLCLWSLPANAADTNDSIQLHSQFEGTGMTYALAGNSEIVYDTSATNMQVCSKNNGAATSSGLLNSDGTSLTFAGDAKIKAVYIQWYALTYNTDPDGTALNNSNPLANSINLTLPDNSVHTVTGSKFYEENNFDAVFSATRRYQGYFADITSLVTAMPLSDAGGTYTVNLAGVNDSTLPQFLNACAFTEENARAWQITVIYASPSTITDSRKVYFYDGIQAFLDQTGVTTPVTGYEVPSSGSTSGKLSVMTLQGDSAIFGETMTTSDTLFPDMPGDFANSAGISSAKGVDAITGDPFGGWDIDTLTGNFTTGSTSMNLVSGSVGDLILITGTVLEIPTIPSCATKTVIATDDFLSTTWDGITWGGGTGWNGGWNDDHGESGGNLGPNLGTDGGEGWNVAIINCNQTNNHNNCEPLGMPKLSLENNDYISRPIDLSGKTTVDFSFSLETTDTNDNDDILTVKVCTDGTESDCKVIYTSPSGDFAATPINVVATLDDPNYLVSTAELFFYIDSFSGSAEYIYIGGLEVSSCDSPKDKANISGAVFKDANTDDIFDASEQGITNIAVWAQKIKADGSLDPVRLEANTNSVGNYQINGLEDGDYQVHVDIGDADLPSDHQVGGTNPLIITVNGVNITGADFPFDEVVCLAFSGEVTEASLPITTQLKTGDKLFLPSKSVSSTTGHLKAYSIDASGVPSTTAEWDAAATAKMGDRAKKLFSTDASGKIVLLDSLTTLDAGIRSFAINSVLGGISRDNSLDILTNSMNTSLYLYDTKYRDFYTSTVSARSKRVLMSSDDGFLYAFNYDTGVLEWAWMPRSLTSELSGDDSFQSKHLMAGTLNILDLKDSANSYATYVVGSYKQGLGHYVLKLATDGSLASVLWDEDQSSAYAKSPNKGEMEYFKDGTGNVYAAYVLTNSSNVSHVQIKNLTDNSAPLDVALNYEATSTPFVMQDYGRSNAPAKKTLYLGSSTGDIHTAALLTVGGSIESAANIRTELETTAVTKMDDNNPTDEVIHINSSIAAKDNRYYLSAQTPTRLSVLKYDSTDSSWNNVWTSYVTGAGSWVSGSYTAETVVVPSDLDGFAIVPPTTGIQSLPADATITDKAVIVADTIVLPLSVLPASSAACYGKAYYYMYALSDGSFPKKSFFKTDNTAITTNIALGYGEARQLTISDLLGKDQLVGYGLSDQRVDFKIGLDSPFVIKDPVATGIRGWKEIGR